MTSILGVSKVSLWILRLPNFRGLLDELLDSVTFSIENVCRYFQRSTEYIICTDSVKKVTEILIDCPLSTCVNLVTVAALGQVSSESRSLN